MPDEPGKSIDPVVVARAAWETLVFAPIGLGAKFVEDAPEAIKRVRQELSNARFIGRLTVEQGASRLRAGDTVDAGSCTRGVQDDDVIQSEATSTLPIEGYDEMPAIEIVGLLEALSPAQRSRIEAHERANRQRRTVLGKIAQLTT